MSEKKSELEKTIESSFVKEDAETTAVPAPPNASFATDPKETKKEEKRNISMGDLLMYIGMKLKNLNDKAEETNKKLDGVCESIVKLHEWLMSKPVQTQMPSGTTTTLVHPEVPSKEKVAESAPAPFPQPQPPVAQSSDPRLEQIQTALKAFIDNNMIEIDSTSSNLMYLVKARMFLGTENFAKIAAIVRGLGGQYVSQGKLSHFEISKAK